jgi:hypothetical protein
MNFLLRKITHFTYGSGSIVLLIPRNHQFTKRSQGYPSYSCSQRAETCDISQLILRFSPNAL